MRVAFVNLGLRSIENSTAMPPLGIMSIAGYLRTKFDMDILLFNQRENNETVEHLAGRIEAWKPDIVGIGGGTTNAIAMADLADRLRLTLPGTLIVLGGPHISAVGPAEVLEKIRGDIAVAGEGEQAAERIIRAYKAGEGYANIPGIAWRSPDGQIRLNEGEIEKIGDLDALPFLPYDLIDIRKYWKRESMSFSAALPYVALCTSRGCPYQCNYCHNIHGKKFRAQSPERIVNEIESLATKYPIKQVEFVDDIFNFNTERVMAFCKILIDRKLGINFSFPNGISSDLLTEEIIDALVSAGLNFCSFALESGSPRIQKVCRKNLNIEKLLDAVKWSVKRGVFTRGFAIIGHPSETAAEVQETIRIACESHLHTIQFFTATPFPGTELYDIAMKKFPQRIDTLLYENANYLTIKINLSEVSDEEIHLLIKNAYKRFYNNPIRIYRIIRDIPTYRGLFLGAYHLGARFLLNAIGK